MPYSPILFDKIRNSIPEYDFVSNFTVPSHADDFKRLSCCVLIPTYNNASKLSAVLSDVLSYSEDVVVVNDGCTDNTEQILAAYISKVQVVRHEKNQGKGVALRTGFRYAYSKGYRYAITLDSDGQHLASDLPTFLEKLETEKNTIFIGARNMTQENVPGKSSFGNKFSNFWFKVETGIDAPDTQSGYRLYPLEPLQKMRFITWKYEFEIEVLVKAAWAGLTIDSVPIHVYYPPKNERISHFRPFKDFTRISLLNTVLFSMALIYHIPLRVFRNFKKKRISDILRETFLNPSEPSWHKALSVSFGIFMGIIPIWGYQLIAAILLAKLFRLNLPIVILTANISIPPNIPWILFLSLWLGAWFLGLDTILPSSTEFTFDLVKQHLKQYLIGSSLLAMTSSVVLGSASYLFFLAVERKK